MRRLASPAGLWPLQRGAPRAADRADLRAQARFAPEGFLLVEADQDSVEMTRDDQQFARAGPLDVKSARRAADFDRLVDVGRSDLEIDHSELEAPDFGELCL